MLKTGRCVVSSISKCQCSKNKPVAFTKGHYLGGNVNYFWRKFKNFH
jgi:hypothetical protein